MNMWTHIGISAVVATVLTYISYALGIHYAWIDSLNWLEIAAVWTSYSCTYLCVFQSRSNYPIGALSVVLLGILFYEQKLFGSMALQIYLFPTLLYGWWRWGPDKVTRPVTHLGFDLWTLGYGLLTLAAFGITYETSTYFDGNAAVLDSSIFAGSILGQFLLDNKKMENWWVWILVDIVSVYEYTGQGLFVVAIQMGLFILNAVWGLYEWNKTKEDLSFEPSDELIKLLYPIDKW